MLTYTNMYIINIMVMLLKFINKIWSGTWKYAKSKLNKCAKIPTSHANLSEIKLCALEKSSYLYKQTFANFFILFSFQPLNQQNKKKHYCCIRVPVHLNIINSILVKLYSSPNHASR